MATIFEWDGGASATPPSGITGTMTVTGSAGDPPAGRHLAVAAGSATAFVRVTNTTAPGDVLYLRWYMKTPTAPASASRNFLYLRTSGAAAAAAVALGGTGAPGQIRLIYGNSGSIAGNSSSSLLTADTWYLLDMVYTPHATLGNAKLAIYSLDSDTPLWSIDHDNSEFTTIDRFDIGRVNATSTEGFAIAGVLAQDTPFESSPPRHYNDPMYDSGPPPTSDYPAIWTDEETPTFPGPTHTGAAATVPDGGWGGIRDSVAYTATGSAAYSDWPLLAAEPELMFSHYVTMPSAWPSAAFNMVTLRDAGAANRLAVVLSGSGQPGRIRLAVDGGATIAQSPLNLLSPGRTYAIEVAYSSLLGRARLLVFAPGLRTPLWSSGWVTDPSFTTSLTRVMTGPSNNGMTVSYDISAVRYTNVDAFDTGEEWFGPLSGDKPDVFWYDGTDLIPVEVSYWTGSDEVFVDIY